MMRRYYSKMMTAIAALCMVTALFGFSTANATISADLGYHWIKARNNGAWIWNPEPTDGESINWSGSYVHIQEGDIEYRLAEGPGTVTWYRYGEIVQVDNGSFHLGRHNGHFTHTFPSGRVEHSDWVDGQEL